MPRSSRAGDAAGEAAPWFHVPAKAVVSIEHPCIVKNVKKAVDMLGGSSAMAEAVQRDADQPLALRFQPHDGTSRSIISYNNITNNVLLKITVPKRTGRKRKRGTDDPFVDDAAEKAPSRDAQYLLRSLQDNHDVYRVEPVGNIPTTHIWRAMPDFVYSSRGSRFMQEFRSKILPQQYPLIKQWDLPQTYGLADTETLPPPVFSTASITQNYSYRQNPAVKQVTDRATGQRILHNTQAPIKLYTYQCHFDTPSYPSTPPADCPPISTQPRNLQALVQTIEELFTLRPIWTRRAMLNHLPASAPIFLARYAIAYVAFALRSGPWRDTYCLLGIDPRTSPEYRKYQTIMLQLVPKVREKEDTRADFQRKWARSRDKSSHVFTGNGVVPEDGKVWQLCDLTDPQLRLLVDIPDVHLRATCDSRYFGWYANGTFSKLRIVLKAKTDYLTDHPDEPSDPSLYEELLRLPESWDGPVRDDEGKVIEDAMSGFLAQGASKQQLEWASTYRSMCRTALGNLPVGAGRLSKSKPDTRASFVETEYDDLDGEAHREAEEGDEDDLAQGLDEGVMQMEIDAEGNVQGIVIKREYDDGAQAEMEAD